MHGFRSSSKLVVLVAAVVGAAGACHPLDPGLGGGRPVASLELTAGKTSLRAGDTLRIHAVALDAAGAVLDSAVVWGSSSIAAATVSNAGLVTGVGPGPVTITAISGGKVATLSLTVLAPLTTIVLGDTVVKFNWLIGAPNPATIGVTVATASGADVADLFVGTVAYQPGEPGGWLSASLTSVATPTTLQVASIAGSLGPGVYHATVKIGSNADGVTNSPKVLSVVLTVVDPTPVIVVPDTNVTLRMFLGGFAPGASAVPVTNGGIAALTDLLVSAPSYLGGGVTGWLAATLSSANAPATLTFTATPSALAPGSYRATVTIMSNGSLVAPRTVVVTLVVASFSNVTSWASQSCALGSAGEAYCWGSTDDGTAGNGALGAVGDGTTQRRLTPTPVAGGGTFTRISAGGATGGNHVCALSVAGATYCWGIRAGVQGSGTSFNDLAPRLVPGAPAFTEIEAGGLGNCALNAAGTAYCWGFNVYGALGDGTLTGRLEPQPVFGSLHFTQLSGPQDYVCGLSTTGTAYCWGANDYGQLGDGTLTTRTVPTLAAAGHSFVQISAGTDHTCGVTALGEAWCWGSNDWGQLGDGSKAIWSGPVRVAGGLAFAEIGAGLFHTCGRTTAGAIYCWGSNTAAQLGIGPGINSSQAPVAVAGGLAFDRMRVGWAHVCGMVGLNTYCWGRNGFGELGDGTTTARFVPTLVRFP